jgi:hypothetical protein
VIRVLGVGVERRVSGIASGTTLEVIGHIRFGFASGCEAFRLECGLVRSREGTSAHSKRNGFTAAKPNLMWPMTSKVFGTRYPILDTLTPFFDTHLRTRAQRNFLWYLYVQSIPILFLTVE